MKNIIAALLSLKWYGVCGIWLGCVIAMLIMNAVAESKSNNIVVWNGDCLYNNVEVDDKVKLIYKCGEVTINTGTIFIQLALTDKTKPIMCSKIHTNWSNSETGECKLKK